MSLCLFGVLSLLNPDARPDKSKVHLATWNGEDDPLTVYLAGQFNTWQSWQNRRNFERPFVVALERFHFRLTHSRSF